MARRRDYSYPRRARLISTGETGSVMSMSVYVDDLFYPQGKIIFMPDTHNELREVDESDVQLCRARRTERRSK